MVFVDHRPGENFTADDDDEGNEDGDEMGMSRRMMLSMILMMVKIPGHHWSAILPKHLTNWLQK